MLGLGRDGGTGIGRARDVYVLGGFAARRTQSAYLEQVRRIAPPVLDDRDAEMAELAGFSLAPDGPSYV
jgi:hypothetical protein